MREAQIKTKEKPFPSHHIGKNLKDNNVGRNTVEIIMVGGQSGAGILESHLASSVRSPARRLSG